MNAVSVVVAAHDEAGAVGGLLHRLLDDAMPGELDVVVVANGCTDDTVAVAREAAAGRARVLELAAASKSAALNEGDRVSSVFPRFYLDADMAVDVTTLRGLASRLRDGQLLAVAPDVTHDVGPAVSSLVRSYYRVWTELPAAGTGISGTGTIGLSRAGRGRFGAWPEVHADDWFCDQQFDAGEKARVHLAAPVRLPVPRSAAGLVRRKARVRNGNLQVRTATGGSASGGNLGGLWPLLRRRPALLAHLPAYVGLTVAARLLAGADRRRGRDHEWRRDDVRSRSGTA